MSISFVESHGGRLAVEVQGDGPLVVCSPGVGDTRDAFAPLAAFLVANGYRVACMDLRGHGDSTAQFDRYGDEAIAEDFLAVVDALGGGPAVLAGASVSGGGAAIAAGRRPDQVAGVVFIGAFLRNGMGPVMRWLLQVALLKPWGPSVWRPQAAKLWPGLGDKARERAAITTAGMMRAGRWAAFRATIGTDHSVVAPWLDHVRAPVLVVIGDADPDWKEPRNEAAWIASNFADAQIVEVPNTGHAPMLERPEVVNPAFLHFLDKIRKDGASTRLNA